MDAFNQTEQRRVEPRFVSFCCVFNTTYSEDSGTTGPFNEHETRVYRAKQKKNISERNAYYFWIYGFETFGVFIQWRDGESEKSPILLEK